MSDKRTTQEILENIETSTAETGSTVFTFGVIVSVLLFFIAACLGWGVVRVYL